MYKEKNFLNYFVKKLTAEINDEQSLTNIKDEYDEFISFLRKNVDPQLIKFLEDIPQIVNIANKIKYDSIEKSLIRLIKHMLINNIVEHCS